MQRRLDILGIFGGCLFGHDRCANPTESGVSITVLRVERPHCSKASIPVDDHTIVGDQQGLGLLSLTRQFLIDRPPRILRYRYQQLLKRFLHPFLVNLRSKRLLIEILFTQVTMKLGDQPPIFRTK